MQHITSIKKNEKVLKIMQFTPQQEQAIRTQDRHLIVTAGAGSGKTRVLVERFLHLLRQNPTWKLTDIVAITFTEKAAREMRDRVRTAIDAQLANANTAALVEQWRHHQAALDAARISTIHGLCTQLLRANPVEARLDPNFAVLDEVQARLLAGDAVDRAIVHFLQAHPLQADLLLQHYSIRQIRLILRNYVSRSVVHQFQMTLTHHTDPATLYNHWQQQRQIINQDVLGRIRDDAALREACKWIDIFNHNTTIREDKLWPAWAVVLEMREHLLVEEIDPDDALDILVQWSSTKNINLSGGAQKFWGDKETVQESKRHLRHIRDSATNYLSQMIAPLNALDEQSAALTLAWRDLILYAADVYNALKAEQNALDFDDLEYLTVMLLENHSQVAERYADPLHGDFKHIMVDEFQDTNDVQRRIIYKLAGMDLPNTGGRLFVVGDPKQSIYAFRGADVRVFGNVQADIVGYGGQVVSLSQSFRTHQYLIENFNVLFNDILPVPSGPVAEYMVSHEAMSAFRPAEPIHQPSIYLKIFQKAPSTAVNTNEWEAEHIAQLIQAWVGQKTVWDRQDGLRPMRYGDIALLFQSLNNATEFEVAFQAAGIPFITIGGRGYFERQEVWDMLNLLAVLYRPSDDLALASVLRSPMIGLSDDALLLLRLRLYNKKPLPLWRALMATELDVAWPLIDEPSDLAALDFAQAVLSDLRQLAGRLTIAELISAALDATSFEATLLAMQDGELRRANVLKLLSVARQQQHVSLSEFTQFIQDMTTFEAREGDAVVETTDTVQLMTVHKSKGLEFPMVILPRCDWSRRQGDDSAVLMDRNVGPVAAIRDDEPQESDDDDNTLKTDQPQPSVYKMVQAFSKWREQAERRRLLYVAMTRAQDYLVMSSSKLPAEKSWTWATEVLRVVFGEEWHKQVKDKPASDEEILNLGAGTVAFETKVFDQPLKRDRRDSVAAKQGPSSTTAYAAFPLLDSPQIHIPGWRLHVSATDLEFFGRVRQLNSATATGEFKMRLLRDQPLPIRPVIAQRQRSTETIIGNVVHRALQMQAVISDALSLADLRQLLGGFAWEEGAIERHQQKQVVDDAVDLLRKYASSELAKQVASASQVFRELEFVYEYERYVIHGMIDLLFEQAGRWYVVDYKTSRIPEPYTLKTFSQRYCYQMGAYAAAVQAQFGQEHPPTVMIYYLRRQALYIMPEADWRGALQTLDQDLTSTLNAE